MRPAVLIGSSIPSGVGQLRVHKALKQGDIVLTLIPEAKAGALAVARYCRENGIHLCFSEFLYRGSYDLGCPYRRRVTRDQFHSKADIDEIIDAAGEYYFGRVTIGEAGGVIYWPKAYTINGRAEGWENLTAAATMDQAQDAYVAYCRKWLDYERAELGKGPLLNVESSLVFKYHAMAGIDTLCLEVMPGDPHLMHAAIRGAARAFGKPWGAHIAMQCYGGMCFDELYQKRWRTSVFYSYITGAEFIYPESGHYDYSNPARRQRFGFGSKEMKRVRGVIREAWQFARIHTRPAGGPKTTLGVVYGKHDGTTGLWNRYAWGQYYDDKKWLDGPAERGWRWVDKFHRKEEWPKETIQGEQDFSGNPPYGQYDVAPIEAPLEVMKRYSCLVFLGWNTMTPAIYAKLKAYVTGGGHLVMYLPHLSTRTDRAAEPKLFRNGDFSDLFGAKITGKWPTDMRGVKCMADSSLPAYRFPLWRVSTDPRFLGYMTPAKVKVTTAKVISGWSDYYVMSPEELASQPVILENSCGRGKAFLVTLWEYPGDDAVDRLAEDILRVVLQGEQGDIRLMSSDRIRYAVYEGTVPGARRKLETIYLLNTDPDCDALVRVWVNGRVTPEFRVPANELRLAYRCGDVVVVPEDKCVDVKAWAVGVRGLRIELFSARDQGVAVMNLSQRRLTVAMNGKRCACAPGAAARVNVRRRVDPARKEFFAPDFLREPAVKYVPAGLPY